MFSSTFGATGLMTQFFWDKVASNQKNDLINFDGSGIRITATNYVYNWVDTTFGQLDSTQVINFMFDPTQYPDLQIN